jgi:IS30 family transposase
MLAYSIVPAAYRLKPLRVHVRTITHDNGKEFAGYGHIARILCTRACFATAYHTGERCVNESTNSLILAFFPMETGFSTNRPAIVPKVERIPNSRPGQSLGIRHVKNHARKFHAARCRSPLAGQHDHRRRDDAARIVAM